MKTSFLFIQLQAPPARALPALSPAATAWTAAPGGPEEGHIFPSPRTGFLAGQDLGRTQGSVAPPSSLLPKEVPGTEQPVAFSRSAQKEKEGEEKPQDLGVRRGSLFGSPICRLSLAPASRKLGQLQPPSCRPPSPDVIMSNGSSSPSTRWKQWPVVTVPQASGATDPQTWKALECSIPQAALAHTADQDEWAVLRKDAAICQVLPKSCKEGPGTPVRARRAKLCRYCPPIQTSRSYPAPPTTLPLKVRKYVWLNPLDPSCPHWKREWREGTEAPMRVPSSSHLGFPPVRMGCPSTAEVPPATVLLGRALPCALTPNQPPATFCLQTENE